MGWLRDIFTGYDYRLTFHDGVREVRYTLETGTSMTLIGPGLDNGPKREGDVADPWYTCDFEATYDDVLDGCVGLLGWLGAPQTNGRIG